MKDTSDMIKVIDDNLITQWIDIEGNLWNVRKRLKNNATQQELLIRDKYFEFDASPLFTVRWIVKEYKLDIEEAFALFNQLRNE